jgi:SAM-dependent methyltransferase
MPAIIDAMGGGANVYTPGWGSEVAAMLARRTAEDRAGFVLPLLRNGMRLVDVGCGPGSITLGLARAVGPEGLVVGIDAESSQRQAASASAGIDNAAFVLGSAYALPLGTGAMDIGFAHALFEHLARPQDALGELLRVLRPDGLLCLASSDWSGARFEPFTADVEEALRAHLFLRRQTGADPFIGGRLSGLVAAAGFAVVSSAVHDRIDMTYADLARYIGSRLALAAERAPAPERSDLARAAGAAARWAAAPEGQVTQRWVQVIARAPAAGAVTRVPT